MEDAAYLKSLVGDYLASVSPNLAKKFKKEISTVVPNMRSSSHVEIIRNHIDQNSLYSLCAK